MIEITPAILVKDFSELSEKLSKFVNITNLVQIDICDGNFVPSVSWPMQQKDSQGVERILNEEEGMPFWDSLDFEFDLMVKDAHKQFDFFSRIGAKNIIFHLEAENESEFKEFLESLDPYLKDNISIGIAINTNTDINKLSPFINYIDFVQCMGISNIGFQGEPFDEKALEQIKNIKEKYPEIKISIDGAVNENTAPLLIKAGATRLVIGSALLNSFDIRETFREFQNL
jgi:ribulose-phosphate 3-epimerase